MTKKIKSTTSNGVDANLSTTDAVDLNLSTDTVAAPLLKPVPPLGKKPVKSGILKPTAMLLAEFREAQRQAMLDTDFPIDMFPPTARMIIEKLHRDEGFCIEYTAMAMLSIAASLIGATRSLTVHGSWRVLPSLFTILVGKPGMGKTPPVNTLLKPVENLDDKYLANYVRDMKRFKNGFLQDKPNLKQIILNDFTAEKFIAVASENPRGTLVHCDEIISLFLMADRYNKGVFLQQLLSMFSGGSLKVSRKEDEMPLVIRNPSINIIGGIQTNLIPRIGRYDSFENGMADRFCFVYPRNQKIKEWGLVSEPNDDGCPQWDCIVSELVALRPEAGASPKLLHFSATARLMFTEWYNEQVRVLNDNPEVDDTRSRKQNAIVARLCIILHELAIAGKDKSPSNTIACETLECAIKIADWLNDSWDRINEYLDDNNLQLNKMPQASPISSDNLYLLRESSLRELTDFEFTTTEARENARKIGVSWPTMKRLLQRLIGDNKLFQPTHGIYHWKA